MSIYTIDNGCFVAEVAAGYPAIKIGYQCGVTGNFYYAFLSENRIGNHAKNYGVKSVKDMINVFVKRPTGLEQCCEEYVVALYKNPKHHRIVTIYMYRNDQAIVSILCKSELPPPPSKEQQKDRLIGELREEIEYLREEKAAMICHMMESKNALDRLQQELDACKQRVAHYEAEPGLSVTAPSNAINQNFSINQSRSSNSRSSSSSSSSLTINQNFEFS